MAAKETAQLVQETIQALHTQLIEQTSNTHSDTEITATITSCFKAAFTQKDINKRALYFKLSAEVHPDKLPQRHPALYAYLKRHNLVKQLQQSLNIYNGQDNNIIGEIYNNPVEGSQRYLNLLLSTFKSIFDTTKRYPEPIRSLINVLSISINVILVSAGIGLLLPIGLAIVALMLVEDTLLRFIKPAIKGQYGQRYEQYCNDPESLEHATKKFINVLRGYDKGANVGKAGAAEQLDAMNDEAYLATARENAAQTMGESKADAAIKKGIRGFMQPSNYVKLKWLVQSFYTVLTAPLPASLVPKLAAILLIRPLTFLLASVFLPVIATLQALQLANVGLLVAGISALVCIKVAPFLLINTPFYIFDALNKRQGRSTEQTVANQSATATETSSYNSMMLTLEDGVKADNALPATAPGHARPLFARHTPAVVPVTLEGITHASVSPP